MQCWLHAAGHLCFASHKRLHRWSTITMLFHSEITSAISGYLPPGNRHLHLAAATLQCHSVGFHRLGHLTVRAPHFRLAPISTSQPQTLPSDCVWVAMGPTLCSRNLLAQGAVITFRQCHWIFKQLLAQEGTASCKCTHHQNNPLADILKLSVGHLSKG